VAATPATASSDTSAQLTGVVSNSAGTTTSSAAVLTVHTAPSITTQPASRTVTAGQTATFSVAATGTAPLTYRWLRSGTVISGATSSTYTTAATKTSDNAAQFAVVISNSAGTITSSVAVLTVHTAPSITTQPASRTVTAGQTATFSVAATGTAPLTYQWQWRRSGTVISGATSSTYTTAATKTSDNAAQFTVTVSNSAGTITSSVAVLTVHAPTLLLNATSTTLAFGDVNVSSSTSKSVTLTNAGDSSITILNVVVAGAGFRAGGGVLGLVLSAGQTASLSATFAPAAKGNATGSVTVTSDASNSPMTIKLSGTGAEPVAHSVSLTWSGSTSVVIGYNVYSSTISGGPYARLNTFAIATTNYTDASVEAGRTYYFVVTSISPDNVESAYSRQVSVIVP
jgi:hypothetical protein